MFNIILYEPEIPPNTGNIIRLCANTDSQLHLIEPLGFQLKDAQLRRAGLDYHDMARVFRYKNWQEFRQNFAGQTIWAFSTKGCNAYDGVQYQAGEGLLFGPESTGLPAHILAEMGPNRLLRIPMQSSSRSLNLSNTVAIGLYEAWRQTGFAGAV